MAIFMKRRAFAVAATLVLGLALAAAFPCAGLARAQGEGGVTVTAQVDVVSRGAEGATSAGHAMDASNVVVWLLPLDHTVEPVSEHPPAHWPQMAQRNKAFEPHVLVIQVGSMVQFPNKDPFFHNVFSRYNGKRFDLGLYEAGSTKSVRFDKPGVSYIFCDIHAEMSAAIVAVESRHFAVSDHAGRVTIPNVPSGRYQMRVWYERSLPDELKALTRTVTISASDHVLEPIRVATNPNFTLGHKDKNGLDYVPPANAGYSHP
ncbi:MAG TPA: hypothetical protein VN661_07120 [Candidatus Acidoferrales bacterium]|nr:hypothetical protein [Candidatus Acidoferrales bacterium]